ncbi:MAG: adenylate/guanylate cyclase domain-containing protein [Candidatus Pacearchaeota archaeon]
MREKIFIIFVFAFILLVSNSSATIISSEINSIYNLGDNIHVESKISKEAVFEGFFKVILNCNGKETLMYFSPIILEKNKEKTITIDFPVTITGSCYIKSIIEDKQNTAIEEAKTGNFILSNKINVNTEINKKEFKPEENLQITGNAVKENGKEVNGVAIIYFNGKEYSISVSRGKFSFSYKFDTAVEPGDKTITIKVKDDNNNFGEAVATIKIEAIPTTLIIETNNESFVPDSILLITPKLLDQAKNIMTATINVKLIRQTSPLKSETLIEELVKSGDSTMFRFTKFHQPGTYVIEASWQNFKEKKTAILTEYKKINVSLEDDILYITNIGNVPFKRKIEISFLIQDQEIKKIMELDLKVGESKRYKLEAPQGTYDIKINTGDETLTFSRIPLTGSVVATIDLEKKSNIENNFLFIILIIMMALIIVFLVVRKITEKQKIKKEMKIVKEKISKTNLPSHIFIGRIDQFSPEENDIKKYFEKYSRKLHANKIISVPVYGTKQEITALILEFQGFEKLKELKKKNASLYGNILDEYFANIIERIKENQGVASLYGNELIILFNIVKQYRHDLGAIKTAEAIRQITNELNNLLAAKGFEYGLAIKAGINTGMANVTSIQNNEVKYTSIGDTTSLAKALKERAIANEILMTETIYQRVANVIKAKKIMPYHLNEQDAINIYSLESSLNFREKHEWYVKRALGKL